MKISNHTLAQALDAALPHDELRPLRSAVAQILCDRPNSPRFRSMAERLLGLHDVPDEAWTAPVPDVAQGIANVKHAIALLNDEFSSERPLHSAVALRRLAWMATQLARRMEHSGALDFEQAVNANGHHTSSLYHAPSYGEFKLDSAAGRMKVLEDVHAALKIPMNGEPE